MPLFGPPNVEKLKAKGDVKGLIKAVDYKKDAAIRQSAAEALGQTRDVQAVEPLIAALKDRDKGVRRVTARALGMIGNARAVEPLVAALKDNRYDDDMQDAVVVTLGQIGDMQAAKALVAMFGIGSTAHRVATEALVKIGSAAVQPLVGVIKDTKLKGHDRVIRVKAAVATLQKVFEQAGTDITLEDLRVIAGLPNLILIKIPEDCLSAETVMDASCSQVRQLARQELIRRGLEA